ncbi:MAG: c-type cytochrome [Gemmatimonadetes bacterium]|nr:c-type cytochrome [Gemmatimonadota bacterium]
MKTTRLWFLGVAAAAAVAVSFDSAAAQGAPGGKAAPTAVKALYDKHCLACHGPRGGAPAPALQKQMGVPTLSAAGFLEGRSDDSLFAAIQRGAGKFMPPFAGKLTKEETLAIVGLLRNATPEAGAKPRDR